MNSLEEEGEAAVGGSALHLPSREVDGWRAGRVGELRVAVFLPSPLGSVAGASQGAGRPAEEFCRLVVCRAPQAPTWGAVFLTELTSTVLESWMRMGWVAGWPYWVHPTWSCFRFLPPSWY